MQNFGIKIDMQRLQGACLRKMTGRTGVTKTCIIIPIEDNPSLFLGEKGVYLNMTANEQENPQYGDTHYVRGDIPRDLYDRMSDEQRRSYPILGNMRPIQPRQQQVTQTVDMRAPEGQQQDDLPF